MCASRRGPGWSDVDAWRWEAAKFVDLARLAVEGTPPTARQRGAPIRTPQVVKTSSGPLGSGGQFGVAAGDVQERGVISGLDDVAVLEHHDAVRRPHR